MAENRQKYLGGYDAGCILGVNEYRLPYAVWEEKTGRFVRGEIDNHHIRRGNELEPTVERYVREHIDPTMNDADAFARFDAEGKDPAKATTGTDLQIMLRDEVQPFVGGHPDGVGAEILHEFKCPAVRKVDWIKEGTDPRLIGTKAAPYDLDTIYKCGLPKTWIYQVQHYLMVTGLPLAMIHVWDPDIWRPVTYPIKPSPALHQRLRDEYEVFWDCVERDVEPTPFTPEEEPFWSICEDDDLDALAEEYVKHYSQQYESKDRARELKSKILTLIGDRPAVLTGRHSVHSSVVDKGSYSYTRLIVKDRYD